MAVNKQETQGSLATVRRKVETDHDVQDGIPFNGSHVEQGLENEPARVKSRRGAVRWWPLAGAGALILTILTILTVYLLAGRSATVDQLVILTVPSGAAVNLNGKSYGTTPVKIEQIIAGNYQLTITKENFEPIDRIIPISDSQPLEFTLQPLTPSEVIALSKEERLNRYRQQAEDAFANSHLAIPFKDSALYYLSLLIGEDPGNQFALDMRERVRKVLHQTAQAAAAHGDFAQAQELYASLVENYNDEDARQAQIRMETQLYAKRGDIRDLIRKAEDAFQHNHLVDPPRMNALYFAKQVLVFDRMNARALGIKREIEDRLVKEAEAYRRRGETEQAITAFERIVELFPDDKDSESRLRDLQATRQAEQREKDPDLLRSRGLQSYREQDFSAAVPDLERAALNNRGTPEVIFSLARSYMKLGQLDKAVAYFVQVPESDDESYRSAQASLGDIAEMRSDTNRAVEFYKRARRLGGSTLYPLGTLDEKIERIEKKQKEKEDEPVPVTIRVKHQHGGLLGRSCTGLLTVDSKGVKYEGSEHVYSSNLLGVAVRIVGDEMTLQLQKSTVTFKVPRADAERFRQALGRYQQQGLRSQ